LATLFSKHQNTNHNKQINHNVPKSNLSNKFYYHSGIFIQLILYFWNNNLNDMITKEQIEEFYAQQPIAMIGVSRNKKKFGYVAFNELKTKGYKVVPVNPNANTIDDGVCYKNIEALPTEVKAAVVLTHKKETLATVEQLIQKGIKQIWIQQGSQTKEAVEFAKKNYANVISGKCIIMFSEPASGIHKFHRSMLGLFGRLPK
jgi:uncharacterized protein